MSGQAAPEAGTATTPPEGNSTNTTDPESGAEELTAEQLAEVPAWVRDKLTKTNKESASYRTKLREAERLIQEAGGEDRIKDLQWRTTTTEGIKSLFEEMTELENIEEILGVPAAQLKSLMGKAQREVTAEVKAQEAQTGVALKPEDVEKLVSEKVQAAVAGVEQKNTQLQLQNAVTNHLKSKGYTDDWSFGVITQMAAKHQNDPDIDMTNPDPMSPYIQALEKGLEDFEEWKKNELSKSREEYLNGKSEDANGAPRGTSSSNPATGEKWDPSSLDWNELTVEARKRGYDL